METPERISRYCRHLGVDFDEAGFSMRTINCLKNAGLRSWRELPEKSEDDLFSVPNFGKVSMREVEAWLALQGMSLKAKAPEPFDVLLRRAMGKVDGYRNALKQAEDDLAALLKRAA